MIHTRHLMNKKGRGWDKMKLGAVWNYMRSDWTLQDFKESVSGIRGHVDFIGIVQRKSLGELPKEIAALGFEEIVQYQPVPQRPEIQFRNQALDLCKVFGCTHLISIDPDEIYNPKQFEMLKDDIVEYDYHTTCAPIYYEPADGEPERLDEFCPMIYRIDERRFGKCRTFPVIANRARCLDTYERHRRRIYIEQEITVKRRQARTIE